MDTEADHVGWPQTNEVKVVRKFIITAVAALALAAPTAALAGDFTGVSTNGTTNDAIGFCVQNGNTYFLQHGTTTGDDRSSRGGATAALIHWAAADQLCSVQFPSPPPGTP